MGILHLRWGKQSRWEGRDEDTVAVMCCFHDYVFLNRILSEFHKLYWPLPQEKRRKKCHKRYCARPATDPPTIPGQWFIISNLLFSIKSPSITTENDNNVKAIADKIFIVGVKNHWRTAQTMSWRGEGSVWGARVRWKIDNLSNLFSPKWRMRNDYEKIVVNEGWIWSGMTSSYMTMPQQIILVVVVVTWEGGGGTKLLSFSPLNESL